MLLNGGTIIIPQNGYTAPTLNADHEPDVNDHVQDATANSASALGYKSISYNAGTGQFDVVLQDRTIGGRSYSSKPSTPNENWQSEANAAISQLNVRNDSVVFNGNTIMNGSWDSDGTAPTPSKIGDLTPPVIGNNVLYETDLTIPEDLGNGTHSTAGIVTYRRVESINTIFNETINQNIDSINDVVVHSPVVCYPDVPNDLTFNQVVDYDNTKSNIVIDQKFEIEFPNDGQHRNITGYGNRDYEDYISHKQIKFDFDVYLMDGDNIDAFINANDWYTLSKSYETFTFRAPHWVSENDYTVYFRTFANNTPASYSGLYETNSNDSLSNYYAVDSIDVAVVGQMYDFSIIGTTESNYDNMFFQADGSNTGVEYYVGNEDKRGDVDSSHINTLPIMPGKNSNTGFANHVLKKR